MKILVFLSLSYLGLMASRDPSLALPPPEDMPEEILRTKIITQARSPLDGELLSAAEYAELQARLAQSPFPPELDSQVRQIVFLLQIRKLFETLNPL